MTVFNWLEKALGKKIKLDEWLVLWAQQVSTLLILIAAITGNYPDKSLDKWQGGKMQHTSFCQITQWKLCQPFVQTLLTGVFTTRD